MLHLDYGAFEFLGFCCTGDGVRCGWMSIKWVAIEEFDHFCVVLCWVMGMSLSLTMFFFMSELREVSTKISSIQYI